MKVGVTGATGWVGGLLAAGLADAGHDVVSLSRRPHPALLTRPFDLDRAGDADLSGLDWIVHAAHDFGLPRRLVQPRTVAATDALLAAAEPGTRVLFVSSLAAHDASRSEYGLAKRRSEQAVALAGGTSIRCGLVFGEVSGGLFGTLERLTRALPVVPLPAGGRQPLHLTEADALVHGVRSLVVPDPPAGPLWLAASREAVTLRTIIGAIASAAGLRRPVVRVPAAAVAALLRGLELTGLSPVRSDSLTSLLAPVSAAEIARLPSLPVPFPTLPDAPAPARP